MSKSLDEVRGLVRDRALKFENEGCYNCHYCGFDCRESCILQDVLLFLDDGAKDIDVPDKSATDICVGDNERTAKVTLSAEPERKTGRKFLEIVVNYPKVCTYPEYEGKPYYSIKYEENGEMIVGYSTYKPEVLSQYLREYFLPSAEPERKKGYWIVKDEDWRKQLEWDECSECGFVTTKQYNFCPNCGADMWGEE